MISQNEGDESSRNKPTVSTEDELLSDIERLTKRVADIGQNATPFKAAGGAPPPPPSRRTPLSAEEDSRLRDLSDEGDLDAVSVPSLSSQVASCCAGVVCRLPLVTMCAS